MVTSLQLPLQGFLSDGFVKESHSRDSEKSQGLSFGEILKFKDKKSLEEKMANVAPVTAALAAGQTLTLVLFVPEEIGNGELDKAGKPVAVDTRMPNVSLIPNSPEALSIQNETAQDQTLAGMQTTEMEASASAKSVKTSPPAGIFSEHIETLVPDMDSLNNNKNWNVDAATHTLAEKPGGALPQSLQVNMGTFRTEFQSNPQTMLNPEKDNARLGKTASGATAPRPMTDTDALGTAGQALQNQVSNQQAAVDADQGSQMVSSQGVLQTDFPDPIPTQTTPVTNTIQSPAYKTPLNQPAESSQIVGQTGQTKPVSELSQAATEAPATVGISSKSVSGKDAEFASTRATARTESPTLASLQNSPEMPVAEPEKLGADVKQVMTPQDVSNSTSKVTQLGTENTETLVVNVQPAVNADVEYPTTVAEPDRQVETPIVDKASTFVSPVSQEPVLSSVSSDETLRNQTEQGAIKSLPSEPANENVKSMEKQKEMKPGIETVAAQTHPVRENFVVPSTGEGSGMEAKIDPAEVVRQVAQQLNARIQGGPTSIRLQLNPKELGAIDVQMVNNSQGVSVNFYADQPSTAHLLETRINQLHQALTDAGLQIAGLNIGQHGQSRHEGGFRNQNQNFVPPPKNDSLVDVKVKEILHPARTIRQPGEVDYLI